MSDLKYIGKILPIEGYIVSLKGNLPHGYEVSLSHMYQPLLGIKAISLYLTLLHEIDLQQHTPQTHHSLMSYLDLPLDEIYQARLKLEGIGLLQTFVQHEKENDVYTYQLNCPFSPSAFFQDAMLTQLLYHQLGSKRYMALQKLYVQETFAAGENVTASFTDVFDTIQVKPSSVGQKEDMTTTDVTVNVDWLKKMLQQRMIPVGKILTQANIKLISQMMTLYNLAEHEVEKGLLWALTSENQLDKEEFQEACLDMFQLENQGSVVKLSAKKEQDKPKQTNTKKKTKEEQLIYELEHISPRQLLEDLSSGGHASPQDLKIVADVMSKQGLKEPVMNVLIHFCLLQSNMKLSKAYMEKIASHWSRANLTTATEAMTFAKREIGQYKKGSTNKNGYTRNNYRKPTSNEVVPDWFRERNEKQNQSAKQKKQEKQLDKERFAELLQEFTSK